MRTRMRFLIIAGVMLLVVIAVALAKNVDSKESADAAAWEYLVVAGGTVNLESMSSDQFAGMRKQPDGSFKEATVLERNLDKLGAKGWELVAVYGSPNNPIYYFKRPKESK
jgi:opacity protein-like surface antigen